MFSVPSFPRKTDRRTNENGGETKSYHRCDLKVDDSPHNFSEALLGEDLKEEKQEGYFDEAEGGEVRNLADPEILQYDISIYLVSRHNKSYQKCGRDVFERYVPHITAQAGERHFIADSEQNGVQSQNHDHVAVVKQLQTSRGKSYDPLSQCGDDSQCIKGHIDIAILYRLVADRLIGTCLKRDFQGDQLVLLNA